MTRTTRLLQRMGEGDALAADELFEVVYGELRDLAGAYMANERKEHTLQPTALVHEVWLRLVGSDQPDWEGRGHFVGVAAQAMRRILVDHARKRNAEKRGGKAQRDSLDEAVATFESRAFDLLALDEALGKLEALDPQLVRIVEQRFFARATNAEIAVGLCVSERTVERAWKVARVFLRTELGPAPEEET